jgi:3-deoxy-D-manno-octulosonic-acid transferase
VSRDRQRRNAARARLLALLLVPAAPLVLAYLTHRLLLRRKGLPGWRDKLFGRVPAAPGAIVVHGVSLGEVNLMPALVPALEAATGARCLLTTSTATGRDRLDALFPQHPRAYLPLDLPWAVERFLRTARPRALVLLELELWPQLLARCHARGVPVLLANARVSAGSFSGWRRVGTIARGLLAPLTLALAQNGTWGARLRALGVRRVRVSGSMKADMVRPVGADVATGLAQRLGLDPARPLLLIASTSAGAVAEEQVALAEGIAAWVARGWQVAVCPRHPERADAVAALITTAGGQPRRASRGEACAAPADVALIDEIGRLGALYAWCARTGGLAVVGGSFGSGRGGQNMLEPCAAGCAVIVGPDTRNFPDAMALLRERDAVVEAAPGALAERLARLAGDAPGRAALGARAQAAWADSRGAAARTVRLLAAALDATEG